MPIFMMHFDCSVAPTDQKLQQQTVAACVDAESLEQAEAIAREVVARNICPPASLIAYSTIGHDQVSALSEDESMLYLRAMRAMPKVAVTAL